MVDELEQFRNNFSKLILSNNEHEQKQLIKNLQNTEIRKKQLSIEKRKVKSVKKISQKNKSYVYDIGMKNKSTPWFFGNNILLHNSAYFSAYPAIKDDVLAGNIPWTKDGVIKLYDQVVEEMDGTFPAFLKEAFNVPIERSTGVIAAGREVIARTGLFIKKKRYAALVYDDEGTRKDVGGAEGKIKAIGLDLRRSDCPVFVQKFLMELLIDVLSGKSEEACILKMRNFKIEFEELKPWEKGVPKAVNGMTRYTTRILEENERKRQGAGATKGFTVPGHVQGSINWNSLRAIHNDLHALPIVDSQKIVLCYLKETADNTFRSIAYPIDEPHLPKWFTELPFDDELMLEKIVDQKIGNLLKVLKWDLKRTSRDAAHAETLFDFSQWQ